MNYPVWEVSFGLGLLMAIVSTVHVFISQFAVGGGLFLVLSERKGRKENDQGFLEWLQIHTKFFVLVTVVFGVVTGVGIWFTIGLILPQGTSALIHNFVWGWAIEWIFFFLEISAALFYLYGWKKLKPKVHMWYGWIYAISAYASLLIINGILAFMLTPGKWLENHYFWSGFFNPTYFPSTFFRTFLSVALAGGYALVTGTRIKDENLKKKVVSWATRWIVIGFIFMPIFAFWYIKSIPPIILENGFTRMPTSIRYANLLIIFSIATLILGIIGWIFSKKLPFAYSIITLIALFLVVWSFEFVREAIRKPYIIVNYMYGNSLYVKSPDAPEELTTEYLKTNGVLKTAKWVKYRTITEENKIEAGKELFRVQCRTCHTETAYRGIQKYIIKRQWDKETIFAMLEGVDKMYNGVMPPFSGTNEEREALAAYLSSLAPIEKKDLSTGEAVFQKYCATCHMKDMKDPMFGAFEGSPAEEIAPYFQDLKELNDVMPALHLSEKESDLLARFIVEFTQNQQQ